MSLYSNILYRLSQSDLDNVLLWIIVFITTCDKHYYDEDSIKADKPTNCKVVVNHHDDQRQQAAPMPKKLTKVKKQENTLQLSIFDV